MVMGMIKYYYVYMLKCNDGSLYTGIASNLEKRLNVHTVGKGSKYVYSRRPFELVYSERVVDRSAASKREFAIKKLKRKDKIALIEAKGRKI